MHLLLDYGIVKSRPVVSRTEGIPGVQLEVGFVDAGFKHGFKHHGVERATVVCRFLGGLFPVPLQDL